MPSVWHLQRLSVQCDVASGSDADCPTFNADRQSVNLSIGIHHNTTSASAAAVDDVTVAMETDRRQTKHVRSRVANVF